MKGPSRSKGKKSTKKNNFTSYRKRAGQGKKTGKHGEIHISHEQKLQADIKSATQEVNRLRSTLGRPGLKAAEANLSDLQTELKTLRETKRANRRSRVAA